MAPDPSPPTTVPSELVDSCGDLSVTQLRDFAGYVEALADHREQEESRAEADASPGGDADETPDDQADDRPDEVPAGASVTVKEINDNRYRYWQWRDGEKIKSKYIGPVNSDE